MSASIDTPSVWDWLQTNAVSLNSDNQLQIVLPQLGAAGLFRIESLNHGGYGGTGFHAVQAMRENEHSLTAAFVF